MSILREGMFHPTRHAKRDSRQSTINTFASLTVNIFYNVDC